MALNQQEFEKERKKTNGNNKVNLSNKDYRSEFIKQGYLHFNDVLEKSKISMVKNEVISVFGSIFTKNNMNDVFKSNEEFIEINNLLPWLKEIKNATQIKDESILKEIFSKIVEGYNPNSPK